MADFPIDRWDDGYTWYKYARDNVEHHAGILAAQTRKAANRTIEHVDRLVYPNVPTKARLNYNSGSLGHIKDSLYKPVVINRSNNAPYHRNDPENMRQLINEDDASPVLEYIKSVESGSLAPKGIKKASMREKIGKFKQDKIKTALSRKVKISNHRRNQTVSLPSGYRATGRYY